MSASKQSRVKLIRYCILCSAIYLAMLACWGLLWFLEPVRMALSEMETVTDAYERQVAFSWLGSLISGSAAAAALLFILAVWLLEKPVLGGHMEKGEAEKDWLGFAGRVLLLAVVGMTILGKNLTLRLYVHPILLFAVVLLLFLLRLARWRRFWGADLLGKAR